MNIVKTSLITAAFGLAFAGAAAAETITFDDPLVLSPTQAAGAWYTDRHAPAGFESGVAYGGHASTLEVTIDGADVQSNSFYNTQGRKYDLAPDTRTMSIQLYIDEAFATGQGDARIAGFWGTAFDQPTLTAYPIVELDRSGGDLVFRGWDSSGFFFDIATLGAGDVGTWQTLTVQLSGDNFTYTAGGVSTTTSGYGSTSIGNVILQAHNTGSDYTVHWDNLNTGVPEPATWALMIIGFGGMGMTLRRRRAFA